MRDKIEQDGIIKITPAAGVSGCRESRINA